jgi:hypothetical protein
MNDIDACARRRAAIVATISHAGAQIARDRADGVANFPLCDKCPWNGHFLIIRFSCSGRARACANADARMPRGHVTAFDADSSAVKFFLHRTRAKALAATESCFERANQ